MELHARGDSDDPQALELESVLKLKNQGVSDVCMDENSHQKGLTIPVVEMKCLDRAVLEEGAVIRSSGGQDNQGRLRRVSASFILKGMRTGSMPIRQEGKHPEGMYSRETTEGLGGVDPSSVPGWEMMNDKSGIANCWDIEDAYPIESTISLDVWEDSPQRAGAGVVRFGWRNGIVSIRKSTSSKGGKALGSFLSGEGRWELGSPAARLSNESASWGGGVLIKL
ncbi:hypothetical protein FB45DRAFT_1105472 [Roridomyces roridus]|uniref:Uncharacterized protein n=1 Tax=Roridomyces roridus TaxID=1738132 RepID=A0AAD7BC68_9AGAR|nr:hypothetical protein FB45DRAFT_1105472 [Roridomyces roridus]